MGARVIKIEQPGRGDDTRAWGPPFVERRERVLPQHQPQQGEPALDLKHPAARRVLDRAAATGRRARRELPAGHDGRGSVSATRRSRRAHPRSGLLLDLGIRPDRTAACRAGLRRGDAGRRRADEHHRRSRWSAFPARRRHRRHRQRHVRRAGDRDGAARARAEPGAGSASTSACSMRPPRS